MRHTLTRERDKWGKVEMNSIVRIEVEPTTPVGDGTVQILVGLLDELRRAKTIADVAIAAGAARQDLAELLAEPVDCCDKTVETTLD